MSGQQGAIVFRGINAVNLDTKGRVAMPTRYRERVQVESAGKLILTIDTEEHCLLLYPINAWEEIEAQLAKLPSFNPQARRIQRLLIGHATEVDMDAQGRMLVPPLLREYAQLDKKIILLGQGNKFEMWSEELWATRRDGWMNETNSTGQLPEELQSISL